MAGELTRKMLEQAFQQMRDGLGKPPARQVVYCHPIDEPFLTAAYGQLRTDEHIRGWLQLRCECRRKYVMGPKQTKYDWSINGLVTQYRQKLEELVKA